MFSLVPCTFSQREGPPSEELAKSALYHKVLVRRLVELIARLGLQNSLSQEVCLLKRSVVVPCVYNGILACVTSRYLFG